MIKWIRKKMNLSIKEVAEILEVDVDLYKSWEDTKRKYPLCVEVILLKNATKEIKKEYLLKFSKEVCKHLKIIEIPLDFNFKKLNNNNAGYVHVVDNVVKNVSINLNEDIVTCMFTILHEFRHIHQRIYMKDFFIDYKLINTIDSTDYNLQKEEIDANAYAYKYMKNQYGIEIKFNCYDEDIKKEIVKRLDEIEI